MSKSREKIIEILRILDEYDKAVGARIVAEELKNRGYDLGERTIRYHMQILDEKGYTQRMGYSGRKLTSLGKSQLKNELIYDHVDFVFSKFEEMIYETNFDERIKKGNVVVNVSKIILDEGSLKDEKDSPIEVDNPIELMKKVFSSGLAVSPLIDIEKKRHKDTRRDEFLIKTISETTIDGILLKHGIPSLPIYGGLIKIKDYIPQRFTELISYKKTSIPPINAFASDGMTSVLNVLEDGNGIIPGNFRVVPEKSLEKSKKIFNDLSNIGINGIVSIGESGEKVLGINVNESFAGVTIIGGVTPLCAIKEMGNFVDVMLTDELVDFKELKPINNITNTGKIKKYNNKKKDEIYKKKILNPPAKEKELKVSFLLSKAWNIMQKVDFDIDTHGGNLIADLSYVNKNDLEESIQAMKKSYKLAKKYISPYYKIVESEKGTKFHDENKVGLATICSLSFDGILINNGIMSKPKYGGLLELKNTSLFTELISYDGSSIDPHEIFIFKNMTSIIKNNEYGYENKHVAEYEYRKKNNEDLKTFRRILASIKEVPFIAREETKEILDEISSIKLPIFKIGKPRELLYNAKVDSYNFGFVTGGGLNPIAAIKENGIDVDVKAVQKTIQLDDMDLL